MKLNTKKTEGVTEKPVKEYKPHRMGSHSDTWGCAGDEDPCYCDKPTPKLGNPHLISYQQGWNEALAEYKQKLIKRLKKTRTPMSGKEKNWWIDFNTVKKALDEVEAVIRVSEG